ncbi:MAG: nucleotidyltransferase family protein [archaeon]
MIAMILAAGNGTRLLPLTKNMPKCMLDVHGKPLIQRQIEWLRLNGISEIIINLHYLPDKITGFLGDGKKIGAHIEYSDEKKMIMGTAGGVKKAEKYFDEDLLVVYGDIFTDLDIAKLKRFHKDNNAFATICIRKKNSDKVSTLIELDGPNIIRFVEKPKSIPEKLDNIENCGIYFFNKKIFDYLPADKFFDFSYDVFPKLIEKENVCGYFLPEDTSWYEIGRIEKYNIFLKEIKNHLIISSQN